MGTAQSNNVRSSAEEQINHIDGGPLVLEGGVYTAPQDWKKNAVRALQLARRLAPFYKGLDEYDPAWSEADLLRVLRKSLPQSPYNRALLTAPSDPEGNSFESNTRVEDTPVRRQTSQRPAFAAMLYQNAVECPICFLFYPVNIATTRCCRQPICTECFVQIRRPNPHPPIVHADDPAPPPENPETLIMEAPVCPYCNVSEFGVVYQAPDFSKPREVFVPLSPSSRDVPATDVSVVLTDMIRPDWAAKLQRAKDRAARRAANAALISAHIQRQERRAQESRNRGTRMRRRDYEALEEEQLAEAIRLSMLDDAQHRQDPVPNGVEGQSSRQVNEPDTRIVGSMPLPDLIYAPPPDSYEGHFQNRQSLPAKEA